MNLDDCMHRISDCLIEGIIFRRCPKDLYPEYEYYYCENCLYLVREKKTRMMLFVDAYSPKEAVETVIKIKQEAEK